MCINVEIRRRWTNGAKKWAMKKKQDRRVHVLNQRTI